MSDHGNVSWLPDDPVMAVFILLIIVSVVFAFVYQEQLTAIWVVYTKWQMGITQYLEMRHSVRDSASYLYEQLAIRDPKDITFSQAMQINARVMRWSTLNMIAVFVMFYLSFKIYRKERFEGELSLEELILANRSIWPHLEFLSRVNPAKYPSTKGLFRERRFPIEYVRDYRIVSKLNSKVKSERKVRFDRLRTHLTQDLGERFAGFQKLPTIRRAMVAAFIAHVEDKPDDFGFRPERQKLMRFLNRIYANVEWIGDPKKEALIESQVAAKVDPILQKYKDHPILKAASSEHGFELTVVMSIVDHATKYGKFTPPAYPFLFVWDRALFFALHELDYHESPVLRTKRVRREPKRGASPEAAAAKSHYFYEKASGRAFFDPKIDAAIDMFIDYLIETNVICAPRGYQENQRASEMLESAWRKHNVSGLAQKKHGVASVEGLQTKVYEGSEEPFYEDGTNMSRMV
ncbi:hypothetical protein [Reinekea sp. G2M2-21]|uniref:secretion/conjugation apparatus DotM-related subunit n=1 Tax=Reinekea sp. G2M2-21 TaxID=2788942 RepID=UPI0018AAF6A5|nr:hypothetical protein [Reinekea sp. G2M2-21]